MQVAQFHGHNLCSLVQYFGHHYFYDKTPMLGSHCVKALPIFNQIINYTASKLIGP